MAFECFSKAQIHATKNNGLSTNVSIEDLENIIEAKHALYKEIQSVLDHTSTIGITFDFSQTQYVRHVLSKIEEQEHTFDNQTEFTLEEFQNLEPAFEKYLENIESKPDSGFAMDELLSALQEAKETISQTVIEKLTTDPSPCNLAMNLFIKHNKATKKRANKILDETEALYKKLDDYVNLSNIIQGMDSEKKQDLDLSQSEKARAFIDRLSEKDHILEKKYVYKPHEIEGLKHAIRRQCDNLPMLANSKTLDLQQIFNEVLEITKIVSKMLERQDELVRHSNQKAAN